MSGKIPWKFKKSTNRDLVEDRVAAQQARDAALDAEIDDLDEVPTGVSVPANGPSLHQCQEFSTSLGRQCRQIALPGKSRCQVHERVWRAEQAGTPYNPHTPMSSRTPLPSRTLDPMPVREQKCAHQYSPKTRCRQPAIYGGTLCVTHAAPGAKKDAHERLLAMTVPAIQRLETLMHQNQSPSVAMTAVTHVLNRTLGVAKDTNEQEKRPQIRIAIAVGGIPLGQPSVSIGDRPAELPAGEPPEDLPDITMTPEMEKAMREDE